MRVSPEVIASLCRQHASELFAPTQWQGTPLDRVRLLWGLAGVESSFGENCTPRHEQGYCYGGPYFNKFAAKDWGCLAHCSFGPWQVMYANFPLGVSPLSLVWDMEGRIAADLCARGAVVVLNRAIARGVRHLSDVSLAYNGPRDEEQYTARLVECMDRPIPDPVAAVAV